MKAVLRQNLTLGILVLIGINMRPLLTSIGPLLPEIRAASGMSYTLAALLTALPVIAMGVLALAAGSVDRYVGQNRSIALSLLIIAAGALLREIAPNSGLLLTSALAGGVGIGIIQAAIPAVIKRLFARRTPLVMGLWSAALMGGGGLGAAFTPWLASHSTAWRDALAWWALPAPRPVQLAGDLSAPALRPASDQRRAPGGDYWPAPRLDAGTLFRTDQRRLRQSNRLAAALLYAAWRQRPVQRLAAGAADGWANRGRAAAAGAGSPG
jgi:MFS family permease